VVDELKITRKTAAKYLDELVDIGVLQKHRIVKDNFYLNIELYELLRNVGGRSEDSHG
jgi:hypothetical protein